MLFLEAKLPASFSFFLRNLGSAASLEKSYAFFKTGRKKQRR
jgi:hypothetical protein